MKLPANIGSTVATIAAAVLAVVFVVRSAESPAAAGAEGEALSFGAKTTAGTDVKFPEDYKGKVVLLDFWATWCGPCVAELPDIAAAYEKYHAQGFEVLSVSLDEEGMAAKLAAFTKEHQMPWPEIYDGRDWRAAIAVQYGIKSIPQAFLVDGDTGKIIADGWSLRGGQLTPAIEKALAAKKRH